MKRILYLIPRFTTGGAERLVLQYTKYFKDLGFEVAVASVVGGGELINEFEKLGVEVFVGQKSLNGWKNLKQFCHKFKPDIIHSHVFSGDMAGFKLRHRAKWISTQHNVGKEHSCLRRSILKRILPSADRVVAVGKNVEDFCVKKLKLKNTILIKNGIEVEKWLGVDTDSLFSSDELNLAIIGRLEKQKGHKYLFKALSKLPNLKYKLHIFGAGSLESSLRYLSKGYNLTDKIIWHGVSTDLLKELKDMDVVIQPSLWEGLSLVIMEAMAAGRLVVTTPAGGDELIDDEEDGFITKLSGLRKTIKFIFENKNEAKFFSLSAREKAKSEFTLEKNLKEIGNLYSSLL